MGLVARLWIPRREIASAVNGILSSTELVVEAAHDVGRAIELYRSGSFGFADLMIAAAARRSGAKELVSVDRRAVVHLNSPGRVRGASHPSPKDC